MQVIKNEKVKIFHFFIGYTYYGLLKTHKILNKTKLSLHINLKMVQTAFLGEALEKKRGGGRMQPVSSVG